MKITQNSTSRNLQWQFLKQPRLQQHQAQSKDVSCYATTAWDMPSLANGSKGASGIDVPQEELQITNL